MQLFENKTIELISENDELTLKFDEIKQKCDFIEEENLYLKAITNKEF